MIIRTNQAKETEELGLKIGNIVKDLKNTTILLDGDLGAGKTTFAKGIAKSLNISKAVNSPTFTILKEYISDDNKYRFIHIDLYRLMNVGEDFDLEEYIDESDITVIEWPFQVEELLPAEYLLIKINRVDDNIRDFNIISKGSKYEGVVDKI